MDVSDLRRRKTRSALRCRVEEVDMMLRLSGFSATVALVLTVTAHLTAQPASVSGLISTAAGDAASATAQLASLKAGVAAALPTLQERLVYALQQSRKWTDVVNGESDPQMRKVEQGFRDGFDSHAKQIG